MPKITKPTIQKPDELAAIDAELNSAMEQLDVTNTKVAEILGVAGDAVVTSPADAGTESGPADGVSEAATGKAGASNA